MNEALQQIKEHLSSKSIALLPTIDQEEIASFEDTFQISLPADYKFFLTEIGSGFAQSRRFLSPKDWEESFWTKPKATNPFKHPCALQYEHEFQSMWLELIHEPSNKLNWKQGDWDPMYGSIAIGDIGCGLYYRMILNGDLEGTIFVWGDHAHNPPKFLDQPGYLNWVQLQIDTHP